MSRHHRQEYEPPRKGYIALESWAGRTRHPVLVHGRTLKMLDVEWQDDALGHRKGQRSYVRPYHVVVEDDDLRAFAHSVEVAANPD